MKRMRSKRGQSIAEYGVLIAIVIGAAIAMQAYVKSRLQGGTQAFADNYTAAIGATGGVAIAPFDPNRTVNSASTTSVDLQMSTVRAGSRDDAVNSNSITTVTKF